MRFTSPRAKGAAPRSILALWALLALTGCNIGYVAHGAYEEARILWKRKPIAQVEANRDLPADTRDKLNTVLAVREFAKDSLGLNVGSAYTTVAPVDKGAIVYVVLAARRDSLEPVEWWFPIVGYVPYRGYFNSDDAQSEARKLEAHGYDTLVRPAVAFSSLGFFSDPVLTNLLLLDKVQLAGVIIHELFHRTYFLASNVEFDESAATWTGSRGAMEFFSRTEGDSSSNAQAAREVYQSDLKFAAFLLQAKAKLLRIYGSGAPNDEILKRREAAFEEIKRDYAKLKPSLSGLERFDLDKQPLNNAVMVNYMIYFRDLDKMDALARINHGDAKATIAEIIELANSDPADPFYAIMEASLSATPAAEVAK